LALALGLSRSTATTATIIGVGGVRWAWPQAKQHDLYSEQNAAHPKNRKEMTPKDFPIGIIALMAGTPKKAEQHLWNFNLIMRRRRLKKA